MDFEYSARSKALLEKLNFSTQKNPGGPAYGELVIEKK